jgi:uncharacterized protein
MKQVEIVGVRVEMPSNQPIVLLRDEDSGHYLPIWIGSVEATAIAMAQQGIVPDRPLTHDLLKAVIEAHGSALDEVRITALRDGVFFADLVFSGGRTVGARPSDALALALRTGTTVFVADDVFAEAGIELPEEGPDENSEVEKFREFLDQISPEDFGMESGPEE